MVLVKTSTRVKKDCLAENLKEKLTEYLKNEIHKTLTFPGFVKTIEFIKTLEDEFEQNLIVDECYVLENGNFQGYIRLCIYNPNVPGYNLSLTLDGLISGTFKSKNLSRVKVSWGSLEEDDPEIDEKYYDGEPFDISLNDFVL
jgi:hypothetical protein